MLPVPMFEITGKEGACNFAMQTNAICIPHRSKSIESAAALAVDGGCDGADVGVLLSAADGKA